MKAKYLFFIFYISIFLSCKVLGNDWLCSDTLFFNSLRLDLLELKDVKRCIEKEDYIGAKFFLLQYKRATNLGKWFSEPYVSTTFSDKIDRAADSICMHYIYDDINVKHPYVNGMVFMGKDFDWLFNPRKKTDPNYAIEWTYSRVARVNFLNKLVQAYKKTGNDKYLRHWIWFMYDFIKDNPPTIKQVWRTLDTAIRVRTWLNAYYSFRNSNLFTADVNTTYLKLIYAHAVHLKNGLLVDDSRTGNHVTTECAALYTIGCVFQEFKEAMKWREIAIDRYMKEIGKVVPPDGFQAELSVSYHYGVVATYKHIYDIAKINNIQLPIGFTSRLLDMYRAPVLLMDQWGDHVKTNDSSRKNIKKMSKDGLKIGYDPTLAWVASNGKEGEELPSTTSLNYAGFYMMRSGWNDNGLFLFFRGGPAGIGHAEQDKLQLVLKAWGKELLFDPGKYPYDQSEWRRFSINTPSHNTAIVDGKWQYREKVIPKKYYPVDNVFCTTPLFDYVSSSYTDGYVTNVYEPQKGYRPQVWRNDRDTTVTHIRDVLYLKPYYALIIDQFEGNGEHMFDVLYHINASAAELDSVKCHVYSLRNDSVQIGLCALDTTKMQTDIIQGQKDPLLGWYPIEHRPIPTVRFRKKQEVPATFATFLYPYRNIKPKFKVEDVNNGLDNSIFGKRIFTEEEVVEVILNKKKNQINFDYHSSLVGNVGIEAKGLVIRQSKVYSTINIGMLGAVSYYNDDFDVRFSKPVNVLLQPKGNSIIIFVEKTPVKILISKPFEKMVEIKPNEWLMVSEEKMEKIKQPIMLPSFNKRFRGL